MEHSTERQHATCSSSTGDVRDQPTLLGEGRADMLGTRLSRGRHFSYGAHCGKSQVVSQITLSCMQTEPATRTIVVAALARTCTC